MIFFFFLPWAVWTERHVTKQMSANNRMQFMTVNNQTNAGPINVATNSAHNIKCDIVHQRNDSPAKLFCLFVFFLSLDWVNLTGKQKMYSVNKLWAVVYCPASRLATDWRISSLPLRSYMFFLSLAPPFPPALCALSRVSPAMCSLFHRIRERESHAGFSFCPLYVEILDMMMVLRKSQ